MTQREGELDTETPLETSFFRGIQNLGLSSVNFTTTAIRTLLNTGIQIFSNSVGIGIVPIKPLHVNGEIFSEENFRSNTPLAVIKSTGQMPNINNVETATMYSASPEDVFFISVTEGGGNNTVSGFVHVPEGAAVASYVDLIKDNTNWSLSVSGLDIQLTNNLGTTRTPKLTVLRMK